MRTFLQSSRRGSASAVQARGFTLMEALVALVVVALLFALALPNYREQAARAKRSDAQTMLLSGAQFLQRWYASNNTYAGAVAADVPTHASPPGANPNYGLELSNLDTTGYTLTAVRTAHGSMVNDRCGDLTYDQFGVKGVAHAASGVAASNCWH